MFDTAVPGLFIRQDGTDNDELGRHSECVGLRLLLGVRGCTLWMELSIQSLPWSPVAVKLAYNQADNRW